MLFDYPVQHHDFEDAESKEMCVKCEKGIVDFTGESDYCSSCRKHHGALCGEEGCMAESAITTEDGLKCERHAALYLEDLVTDAYQYLQMLHEEHDEIADMVIKVEHEEEGKETNPAQYQEDKYTLERMRDNHTNRISMLSELMIEIDQIQEKLDVELVMAKYQRND